MRLRYSWFILDIHDNSIILEDLCIVLIYLCLFEKCTSSINIYFASNSKYKLASVSCPTFALVQTNVVLNVCLRVFSLTLTSEIGMTDTWAIFVVAHAGSPMTKWQNDKTTLTKWRRWRYQNDVYKWSLMASIFVDELNRKKKPTKSLQ